MSAPTVEVGTKLPELSLYGDPTFIISTALATRDFQDVHHDRDLAQAKGSKDIFVNILTDTGLVQRFVTDWAGPRARVRMAQNLGVPERLEEIEAVAHLTRMALNGLAMESVFIGRASPDAPKVLALLKEIRQRLVNELQNGAGDDL